MSTHPQTSRNPAPRSTLLEEVIEHKNLWKAWEAVRRNQGAPGIDHRSVTDLQGRIDRELNGIQKDVRNGTYHPKPLITFPVKKSKGGVREISIATTRDRITSRAMAQVMGRHCNGRLSPHAYAFRPGTGTLKAVRAMQRGCKECSHVLRADIASYFDEIDHELLASRLESFGIPEDLLGLVVRMTRTSRFDGVANLIPERGIPQGSPLSPLLANVYLDAVDRALEKNHPRFIRYADDIAVLCGDAEEAMHAMRHVQEEVTDSRLRLSIDKTRVYAIEEGVLFLGFIFNRNGHCASSEARRRLREKLDAPPPADELPEETKVRRAQVERGWNNYFEPGKEVAASESPAGISEVSSAKVDSDISRGTAPVVKNDSVGWMSLRRNLASEECDVDSPDYLENLRMLAEEYLKQGLHKAADACLREAGESVAEGVEADEAPVNPVEVLDAWTSWLDWNPRLWKRATVDRLGRLMYREIRKDRQTRLFSTHFAEGPAVAVPVYDPQGRVRFGVLDLDISRAAAERFSTAERDTHLEHLRRDAMKLSQHAREMGVPNLVEASGYKGYHVWFFLQEPVPAGEMLAFLQELVRVSGEAPSNTHREMFPPSKSIPPQGLQTHIKFPGGCHPLTGTRSVILDHEGNPLDIFPSPENLEVPARALRSARAIWSRDTVVNKPAKSPKESTDVMDPVERICEGCTVLCALREKAKQQHDLNHAERSVVRGILESLPKGREAVHDIIRPCEDYDPRVTNKYLGHGKGRVMACSTIREILGSYCERVGCDCRFRKLKKEYAHPQRHLRQPRTNVPVDSRPKKSPAPESNTNENLSELLQAYHQGRVKLIKLQKQLREKVEREGGGFPLGRIEETGPDSELREWVIKI